MPYLQPRKTPLTLTAIVWSQTDFRCVDRVIVVGVADAGVVEEDVQLAVGRFGRGDHPLAVGRQRDIGLNVSGGAAALADIGNALLPALCIDIDRHD